MSDLEVKGIGGRLVVPSWDGVGAACFDGNVQQRAKDLSATLNVISGIVEKLTPGNEIHADLARLVATVPKDLDALRAAVERHRLFLRIGEVEQNLAGMRRELDILSEIGAARDDA